MSLRNYLTRFIEWCPLTPGNSPPQKKNILRDVLKTQKNMEKRQHLISGVENKKLLQLCPVCQKLVDEEDIICPFCNSQLSFVNDVCPFCKEQITDKDTICPHCDNLLISEYPKQIAAKRNAVLFPLGFLLILSVCLYEYLIYTGIELKGPIVIIFMGLWFIGFAVYGAYVGKGDKDFWWGK